MANFTFKNNIFISEKTSSLSPIWLLAVVSDAKLEADSVLTICWVEISIAVYLIVVVGIDVVAGSAIDVTMVKIIGGIL